MGPLGSSLTRFASRSDELMRLLAKCRSSPIMGAFSYFMLDTPKNTHLHPIYFSCVWRFPSWVVVGADNDCDACWLNPSLLRVSLLLSLPLLHPSYFFNLLQRLTGNIAFLHYSKSSGALSAIIKNISRDNNANPFNIATSAHYGGCRECLFIISHFEII